MVLPQNLHLAAMLLQAVAIEEQATLHGEGGADGEEGREMEFMQLAAFLADDGADGFDDDDEVDGRHSGLLMSIVLPGGSRQNRDAQEPEHDIADALQPRAAHGPLFLVLAHLDGLPMEVEEEQVGADVEDAVDAGADEG